MGYRLWAVGYRAIDLEPLKYKDDAEQTEGNQRKSAVQKIKKSTHTKQRGTIF